MNAPTLHTMIEPLESRIAPATVSAGLFGSTLRIVALDAATPVNVAVIQIDADSFSVIDVGGDAVVFDGVKKIQATLSNGNDQFTYNSSTAFRGSVTVTGNTGIDVVAFNGSGSIYGKVSVANQGSGNALIDANFSIFGNLAVTTQGGGVGISGKVDSLTASGVSVLSLAESSVVGGKARITTAPAGSEIYILGDVLGSLTVVGNAGPDSVALGGETRGKINLLLGDGNNELETVHSFSASSGLTYRGGSGDDTVLLNATVGNPFTPAVNGAIRILLGDGNNGTAISAWIAGSVQINSGSGDDTVSTQYGLLITGTWRMNLGDGVNQALIGSENGGNTNLIYGGFQYRGGMGADTVQARNMTVGGATKLTLGDGVNYVTMVSGNLSGALTMIGGSGNDGLSLGGTTIRGKTSLSLGDGTNLVIANFVQFHGGISYKGGANDDSLALEGGNSSGPLTFNGGNGANTLLLDFTSTATLINYKGGVNTDSVSISSPAGSFLRANIKLGDGNDIAGIEVPNFISFRIDGGAGADSITRVAAAVTAGLIATGFETVVTI